MGIGIKFEDIEKKFNPKNWSSIEEFEEYYLQQIIEKGEYVFYTDRNGNKRNIDKVDHHPELKEYEVWEEGYCVTGNQSNAILIGKTKARCFAQACHIIMAEKYLEKARKENDPNNKEYLDAGRWDYDPQSLSNWCCRLFWSKELACKSFG